MNLWTPDWSQQTLDSDLKSTDNNSIQFSSWLVVAVGHLVVWSWHIQCMSLQILAWWLKPSCRAWTSRNMPSAWCSEPSQPHLCMWCIYGGRYLHKKIQKDPKSVVIHGLECLEEKTTQWTLRVQCFRQTLRHDFACFSFPKVPTYDYHTILIDTAIVSQVYIWQVSVWSPSNSDHCQVLQFAVGADSHDSLGHTCFTSRKFHAMLSGLVWFIKRFIKRFLKRQIYTPGQK